MQAGAGLVREVFNEWSPEGGVLHVDTMGDLLPHIPWLRVQLAEGVRHHTLRKRLLVAHSVRVGESLMRRWIKAELASQDVLPVVGLAGKAEPVRQLHDLDDMDVYGQEFWDGNTRIK